MIWLFVILGAVGLASSLQGVITGLLARRAVLLPIVIIVLFVGAWVLGHSGVAGWVTLICGILLEAFRRAGVLGSASPDSSVENVPEAQPTREIAVESVGSADLPGEVATDKQRPSSARLAESGYRESAPPPLTTMVLLSNSWQLAPGVLVASLRRCGERTAKLEKQAAGEKESRISVGPVVFEFEYLSGVAGKAIIEEAAAQSWDWAEAQQVAEKHVARIRITSRVASYSESAESSREGVLRLHCRTHQALAEFAPVVAILWPDSGRLLPPVRAGLLASEKRGFALAAATAVNFRTYPPESGIVDSFVCDSIGLDSLGLSDLQMEVPSQPDESMTRDLYALAQWQFEKGCPPNEEMSWPAGDARWHVKRGSSIFGKARAVMVLVAPPSPDVDTPPPSATES